MNILCKLFGHVPAYGWLDDQDGGYFSIGCIITDGMGVKHAFLDTVCERCHTKYRVGRVHLPKEETEASKTA